MTKDVDDSSNMLETFRKPDAPLKRGRRILRVKIKWVSGYPFYFKANFRAMGGGVVGRVDTPFTWTLAPPGDPL